MMWLAASLSSGQYFTMMAVPSSGEPKVCCECLLIGVCVNRVDLHTWVLACPCAFGQVSECTLSQAYDVFVQAPLIQTHHGTYSFPVRSEF